jgi:hypothetical protein
MAFTAMSTTGTIPVMVMLGHCQTTASNRSITFTEMKRVTGKVMWAMPATTRATNTDPEFREATISAVAVVAVVVVAEAVAKL